MRLPFATFHGIRPILASHLLPAGYASIAVNVKLTSGDLESFNDLGNPFTLSKSAPINAVFKIANGDYLQWSQSEVAYGTNIDVSYGTIPGDTTGRVFITGLSGGPKQTNTYYATDPTQQGLNVFGAYPYVVFPVGIADPVTPLTVVADTSSNTATPYEYAQAVTVNNVIIASGGTGYAVSDVLTLSGGTVSIGLPAAQITVTTVDATGKITGVTLLSGGFYDVGPTGTQSATGGSGSGATFNSISLQTQSFNGLNPQTYDNGAGSYIHWNVSGAYLQCATGQGDLSVAYTNPVFSFATATAFTYQLDAASLNISGEYPDLVYYLPGSPGPGQRPNGAFTQLNGAAIVLSPADGTFKLYTSISGTNGGAVSGTVISSANVAASTDTYYRVTVTATKSSASTSTGFSAIVTLATQAAPNVVLATLTGFIPYQGELVGFGTNHRFNSNDGVDGNFQNFYITVTQPASQTTAESTNYVYTYVTTYGTAPNEIVQESGPSDPSNTVTTYLLTNAQTGVVTRTAATVTFPATPAGLDITALNLYRLVLLTTGSEVYEFVTQLPPTTTTYVDTKLDSQLGGELVSATFLPPPSNLQGILSLPNGIMAGFFDNTLALSAQNYPYAWPVGNQLSTDYPIVGIAAIDTTVTVITSGAIYTAYGNTPDAYTMSKESVSEGGVSKRGIAIHKRYGVLYPAGSGLQSYRGQGQLVNITKELFSVEQWQALVPSSIIAVVYDDFYLFWYDTGTVKGGYMLDLRNDMFNLTALDFHVTAAYVDPRTNKFYITPDFSVYPINGSIVSSASNVLSQWEGSTGLRPYQWERDQNILGSPETFSLTRLIANTYANTTLTLASEQGTAYNAAVTRALPFIIAPKPGRIWSVKVVGTDTINQIEVVSKNQEFEG